MITICFDDGRVDTLKWTRYLKQWGIRATVYVNPANIGTPGFLTLEHLTRIKNEFDCLIANHLWDHNDCPASGKTIDEIITSYKATKAWLDERGFSEASDYVSIPYGWMGGKWSDKMIAALLQECKQIRDVSSDGFTDVGNTKRLYSICDCLPSFRFSRNLKAILEDQNSIFGVTFHSNQFISDKEFCAFADELGDLNQKIHLVNEL